MKSFTKYFVYGALLALPVFALADPPPPCYGIYPSCCPTCASKPSYADCHIACAVTCSGIPLNTCEAKCLDNCP